MLARREISKEFQDWNLRWGAPFGHTLSANPLARIARRLLGKEYQLRSRGPFALQGNSDTRYFEYPWAFLATQPTPGMRVLEVGGGLSGFQFVMSRSGCHVVNVDPGMSKYGWVASAEAIDELNRQFGTSVVIKNCGIEDADLDVGTFDVAISISVLEHLPIELGREGLRKMFAALRPGGRCILTIDLFLDVAPFTGREENSYGRNISIPELIGGLPCELVVGHREELCGFPEFRPQDVLANLPQYLLGQRYPVLTQLLILRKPGPAE